MKTRLNLLSATELLPLRRQESSEGTAQMLPFFKRSPRLVLAGALVVGLATAGITDSPSEGVPATEIAAGMPAALVPTSSGPQVQLGAAGGVIGFSGSDGSGTQTITLVDTRKSWMAVYHIGTAGEIRLVSSRPIDADFSLQLNAISPLPEEIRALRSR
ncbi:MAG: hypothetical protein AAGI63_09785 [Planctomycetota bacterium]